MNRKRVLSGIAVLIALSLFVTPGRAESKRPDTIVDLKEVLPSAILDIRYQVPTTSWEHRWTAIGPPSA